MDPLPLVPRNEEDHDVLPILREVLQDALRGQKYPQNVAENYKKYKVSAGYNDLKTNGLATIKILEDTEIRIKDITSVEEELMRTHAMAIIQKHEISPIFEELRLKRHSLFQKLSKHALEAYELIQKSDIYPNLLEQYLDFTYNPSLYTCRQPCPSNKTTEEKTIRKDRVKPTTTEDKTVVPQKAPFRVDPEEIVFRNYELGRVYKKKFKLRNVSNAPQNFYYLDFPKSSQFTVKMLTDSCRLAPGMCADFLVIFQPQMNKDGVEYIKFKSKNLDLSVPVSHSRDSPKLICYVVNFLLPDIIRKSNPGSRYFSEQRRKALNFTIDCGACLLGNYSLITVIMQNEGPKGRFLITTEDEWFFDELNEHHVRSLELSQGCFTIFPTFFEIEEGEVGKIFIMFVPDKEGFFNENLFFICDNNCHQEVEIMGDCVIFTDTFLTVNMYLLEDSFFYCQRRVNITLTPYQTSGFVLSLINDGPIHFNYYWALKTCMQDSDSKKKMDPDWIKILFNTQYLPPFSVTDVVVNFTPKTEEEGCYYIYLSLYLRNIPLIYSTDEVSTAKSEKSENKRKSREKIESDINTEFRLADVHIFELGIFCNVKVPEEIPQLIITTVNCTPVQQSVEEIQQLALSQIVINFGLVPKGVQASKNLFVKNLSSNAIEWKILEYICTDYIFTEVTNLNISKGTLKGNSRKKLTYTFEAKECTRRVSLLLLFSCPTCTCQDFIMESVCFVVCEVVEAKISIQTETKLAALCPQEFIYVGIPSVLTIYVQNGGALTGCFYFLKPTGLDSGKIRLRFLPQSGVVPPGATSEVKVELTGLEYGIIEDVSVPCFVGDPEKMISLRVFCTVATINVYFYLPNMEGGYKRVLWPPKLEMPTWDADTGFGESCSTSDLGACDIPSTSTNLLELIGSDSVAANYPTIKTKKMQVKKASKLTFYIENLTPIQGQYSISATNYGPETDCLDHILVKARRRTPEFFWDKVCLDGCGIVIEPANRSGTIVPYEVVEIDLWIYANTWGKYLEEVIIEINDLTPFCFNLLIEVVGLPIEFPFARNTILPCPTIRFDVAYSTKNNTKSFTVANISSVPVEISWHIFSVEDARQIIPKPFSVLLREEKNPENSDQREACRKCVNINPVHVIVEKQSTVTMLVTVNADSFLSSHSKFYIKYNLIGFIGIRNCDKESYFKRDDDFTPAKIELLVTIEMPIMQLDVSSGENTIDVFVNDILLHQHKFPQVYMVMRNVDTAPVYFSIEIEKPFKIIEARTVPSDITNVENLFLRKNECLQVTVTCHFSPEDLLEYATMLYQQEETKHDKVKSFTSIISKDFTVHQQGCLRQVIPFQVRLHYPLIKVKPHCLKFGHCLLYRSKKMFFTIYNMTGSTVKFEIYKTTKSEDFEVSPDHGEIARNTGVNRQFVDIAVYFSPRCCKPYGEQLRIVTNIPNYFIDIVVVGHGSNDEKFNPDY